MYVGAGRLNVAAIRQVKTKAWCYFSSVGFQLLNTRVKCLVERNATAKRKKSIIWATWMSAPGSLDAWKWGSRALPFSQYFPNKDSQKIISGMLLHIYFCSVDGKREGGLFFCELFINSAFRCKIYIARTKRDQIFIRSDISMHNRSLLVEPVAQRAQCIATRGDTCKQTKTKITHQFHSSCAEKATKPNTLRDWKSKSDVKHGERQSNYFSKNYTPSLNLLLFCMQTFR